MEPLPSAQPEVVLNPVRPLVLLVEDHSDTGNIFRRLLAQYGYEVYLATNVAEAIELFEKKHFDILISDIGLPDGSGLDVMRYVSSHRYIPAIAVSALSSDEDVQRTQAAGFMAHLAKPIDMGALRELLAEFTDRSR